MKTSCYFLVLLLSIFSQFSATQSYGQTANLALNFDGTDDIVTIPNNSVYNVSTGNFTMEAWIKLNGTQTTFPTVLSKRDAANANSGFLIMIYQGKIFFQIGGTNIGLGVANVQDGFCHHIAIVRTGTTVIYYVDGNVDVSFTNISQSINTTHALWVGRDENALSTTRFKGTISEVRYWNIARTQSQISTSRNVFLTGTESGLKGYWRLNDGTGQTVNDYTTANNDGYLGSSVNVDASDPTYVPGCLVVCTPPPAIITSNGTNICTGGVILLSANTGTGYTYQWRLNSNVIAGATSSTFSATAVGSYICQVSSNGCTNNSNTITLTSSAPTITITYSGSTTICSGSSKLLTASHSGSGTSPTFQWKLGGNNISGATASTYNATQTGVYTVTITNSQNGCSATSNSVSISVLTGPPNATITNSGSTTSCYSVYLTATPTGSGNSYQWQRNNVNIAGATSSGYFSPQSGNYRCVVTNACGSSNSNTLAITLTGTGQITASGSTSFCSGSVYLFAPTLSGANYQWTNNGIDIPGAVNDFYLATTAGIFSCRFGTVTCGFVNATNSITVSAPAGIIASGATEVCTGPVTLNAFPNTGATYQWKFNGANIAGATLSSYDASNSGIYSCTVTTTQCGATNSSNIQVTLGVPTQVTLAPPAGNGWNYDFCSTYPELTALPANAGTYNWYNDPSGLGSPYYTTTDNVLSPLYTGIWHVELVTACGSSFSTSAFVRDINSMHSVHTFNNLSTICTPGSTALEVYEAFTNNYGPQWNTYQWKFNGANISGANGPAYYPTQTGYYSCSITNSCGTACCVDSTLITVLSTPNNTITASGPLAFCQGQSVTLSVPNVAGNTYTWYRNNQTVGNSTNSYTANIAGTYKVRIINACSTIYSADQVVTLTQPITATLQANNPTVNCSGNPIILSASTGTGYIYEWYKNSIVIPGATTSNYSTSITGNYHARISTSNGCYNTTNVMLAMLGNASAAISSTTTFPVCESGNVYLNANATGSGNTYQWKLNGVAIPNITSSSYSFSATATGNYTVDVTNLCGTFTSPPFAVTVNPAPPATVTPAGPTTFCPPASVVLNANTGSGFTYQWYGPSGIISGATSSSHTATVSGNYSVRETYTATGCFKSSPVVIINSANITATVSPAGIVNQCNGSVLLTANTGAGLTYQWKKNNVIISGATSSTYSAVLTGNYTVTITNSCGTSTSVSTNINFFAASPSSTITAGTIPTCSGPNSTVFISATSIAGQTYQWKRNGTNIAGATSYGYSASLNGNYTCVITNACGSVTSNTISINMIAPPAATITAAGPVTFCQGGSVVLNANTGTGLTYQWRNNGVNISGATAASYTALVGGTFSCAITNVSGCVTISNNLNVFVTTNTATITPAGSTTICMNTAVMLNANTGGTSYQWKLNGVNISGATSSSYNATTGGNFTVVVTTSCGSVTSAPVTITLINNPTATITAGGPTTFCAGQSVVFTANSFPGVAYKWQKNNVTIPGATAQTYIATTTGAYRVKETANGCSKFSTSINVLVNCRIADPNYIHSDIPLLSIQPNPFSEQAEVLLSQEIDLVNAELEIYDMTGKLVNRITVIDEYTITISKGNMLPGLYLLMLKSGGSLTGQLKFIIE